MAKKKTICPADLLKAFFHLHANEQQEIVDRLPVELLIKHPWVKSYLNGNDMEVEIAKSKRPKKRGKPARDEIIIRLVDQGLSDGQIMMHDDVIRANGGKAMNRKAVQSVRRRKGRVKKR